MANLELYDDDTRIPVAQLGGSAEYVKWVMNSGPLRIVAGTNIARMIVERRPVQIADLRDSSEYRDRRPNTVALVEMGGARTYIVVPMLKEGCVVGGIIVLYAAGIAGIAAIAGISVWAATVSTWIFIPGDLVKAVLAALVARGVHAAYPGLIAARRNRTEEPTAV